MPFPPPASPEGVTFKESLHKAAAWEKPVIKVKNSGEILPEVKEAPPARVASTEEKGRVEKEAGVVSLEGGLRAKENDTGSDAVVAASDPEETAAEESLLQGSLVAAMVMLSPLTRDNTLAMEAESAPVIEALTLSATSAVLAPEVAAVEIELEENRQLLPEFTLPTDEMVPELPVAATHGEATLSTWGLAQEQEPLVPPGEGATWSELSMVAVPLKEHLNTPLVTREEVKGAEVDSLRVEIAPLATLAEAEPLSREGESLAEGEEGFTSQSKGETGSNPLATLRGRSREAPTRTETASRAEATEWNFQQLLNQQESSLVSPRLVTGSLSSNGVVAQVERWMALLDAGRITVQEGEVTSLEFELHPRNLGKLTLKMEMVNGELRAYFATQSQIVKEALESNRGELHDLLQQQGLALASLHVQVGSEGNDTATFSGELTAPRRVTSLEGELGEAPLANVQRAGELWQGLMGGRLYLRI